MNTKIAKPKTKKAENTNGKKPVSPDSEYETADQVRSLKNGDVPVSAEDRKMYRLLMRALGDEAKN